MLVMMKGNFPWQRWLFGDVAFAPSQEYNEFRYKFVLLLMLAGAVATALFVAGELSQVNPIQTPHMVSMQLFTAASLLCYGLLRGRPRWFRPLAWAYELACLMEYTSALWLVPQDELRLLWFYINVPGVFLLLGPKAGWFVTLFTCSWLVLSNTLMPNPYSSNAMATAVVALLYLGVFFHVFSARSISYFVRMRDANRQLQQMASHDMLTGVMNARAYYARCDELVGLAQRSGQPYAVLFVDLDHFKRINDQHGHAAGDAVLKAVAKCLQGALRKSDALGRIGGEEFSIFLPRTPRDGAVPLAETVRAAVETLQPEIAPGVHLRVTASVGVAVCDGPPETMQTIQQRADQAMYQAKAQGRNRVSVL